MGLVSSFFLGRSSLRPGGWFDGMCSWLPGGLFRQNGQCDVRLHHGNSTCPLFSLPQVELRKVQQERDDAHRAATNLKQVGCVRPCRRAMPCLALGPCTRHTVLHLPCGLAAHDSSCRNLRC